MTALLHFVKTAELSGFTESLKEIGYQGVRRGDLVIHAMDAFAGATGVSDSDGKSTPVYAVCSPTTRDSNPYYYAYCVREMARSQWIVALSRGVRERSTDFDLLPSLASVSRYHPAKNNSPSSASSTMPTGASGATSGPRKG